MSEPVIDNPRPRYRPGRGANLALTAPCLYPGCGNSVTLRLRGGLPTQFCSDDCRSNYRNISRRLQRTEATLVAAIAHDPTPEHALELDNTLRVVRWHRTRFTADSSG